MLQNDAQVGAQRTLEFCFFPVSAISQCVACRTGHFLRVGIAFVRFFFVVVNEICHAGFLCFVFILMIFVLNTNVALWVLSTIYTTNLVPTIYRFCHPFALISGR